MQISIKGELSMDALRQALFEQLSELEEQFAIAHSRGATLYVNPTNGNGDTVVARTRDGRQVTRLESAGPYRSAAEQFKV